LGVTVSGVNGAAVAANVPVLGTNNSKQLVSKTTTGTAGTNVVLADSPSFTGTPSLAAATATSLTVGSPTNGACGTGCVNAQALQINGVPLSATTTSSQFTTVTGPGSYTCSATQSAILVNAAAGNVTVTLATAVGATFNCIIKRIDASANTVNVVATNPQTIDGQTSKGIQYQYTSANFKSDNSNWWIY
jgi:hypothetical protein